MIGLCGLPRGLMIAFDPLFHGVQQACNQLVRASHHVQAFLLMLFQCLSELRFKFYPLRWIHLVLLSGFGIAGFRQDVTMPEGVTVPCDFPCAAARCAMLCACVPAMLSSFRTLDRTPLPTSCAHAGPERDYARRWKWRSENRHGLPVQRHRNHNTADHPPHCRVHRHASLLRIPGDSLLLNP